MPNPKSSNELLFAVDLCKQAGEIAMKHLRQGIQEMTKEDGTPVTRADKECERLIRDRINQHYPGDSILGEEEGGTQVAQGRRWIVDPIDGTYNYARSMPIFATLLALEIDGEAVVGVVHAPAMQETYWAEKGGGAFKNGLPIHVSKISDLAQSQFNFGEPARVLRAGLWPGFTDLIQSTRRQRGYGDYLSFGTVFEGKAEATIEIDVHAWDLAPMKIIAEEAGGKFTNLEGKGSYMEGSCLVSNGLVHDQVLKRLTANRTNALASKLTS
jgi:histidinol-phosphatase